jgi:hypothetical protein
VAVGQVAIMSILLGLANQVSDNFAKVRKAEEGMKTF